MIEIDNRLSNIFDQYDQEENRITNSLLQTLAKNTALLKAFFQKNFSINLGKNSIVVISSQKEPFALGDEEDDRERIEGIPDGWIIIDEEKAIVFESKIVRDAIRRDQLRAHAKRIKGYGQKYLCVITPDDQSPVQNLSIPNVEIKWVSWRDIYDLVGMEKEIQDLSGYLRNQLKEYLAMKEDLVGFQGIDYPSGAYTPREAKIIIKSLIREIKPEILKIYPNLKFERKAYSQDVHPYTVFHRSTWSFLGADENFTKDMHITFWLTETHLGMGITIPNNAGKRWKRLRQIFNKDKFFDSFVEKLDKLRSHLPNLYLEFVHRHYIRQRDGVIDGILEMDLDTVKGSKKVKVNQKWLEAIRELIRNKRGYNGQLMLRTRFFYKDYPEIKTAVFKNKIIKTAYDFRDIYKYLLET
jgi:hypothetical protein